MLLCVSSAANQPLSRRIPLSLLLSQALSLRVQNERGALARCLRDCADVKCLHPLSRQCRMSLPQGPRGHPPQPQLVGLMPTNLKCVN